MLHPGSLRNKPSIRNSFLKCVAERRYLMPSRDLSPQNTSSETPGGTKRHIQYFAYQIELTAVNDRKSMLYSVLVPLI